MKYIKFELNCETLNAWNFFLKLHRPVIKKNFEEWLNYIYCHTKEYYSRKKYLLNAIDFPVLSLQIEFHLTHLICIKLVRKVFLSTESLCLHILLLQSLLETDPAPTLLVMCTTCIYGSKKTEEKSLDLNTVLRYEKG